MHNKGFNSASLTGAGGHEVDGPPLTHACEKADEELAEETPLAASHHPASPPDHDYLGFRLTQKRERLATIAALERRADAREIRVAEAIITAQQSAAREGSEVVVGLTTTLVGSLGGYTAGLLTLGSLAPMSGPLVIVAVVAAALGVGAFLKYGIKQLLKAV